MMGRSIRFAAIAACAVMNTVGQAAPPEKGVLESSDAITSGSWNIAFDDGTSRKMCIEDVQPLLQLAHAGPACGRLVIEDKPDRATVHYTCPGAGWGRTSVLVETPRLVRINSQGIASRMPFAFDAEARRIGPCESMAPRKSR
jgi:hypothetical protein